MAADTLRTTPTPSPACDTHDPALNNPKGIATGVATLHDIGSAEYAVYRQQGFLVVERALNEAEVAKTLATIDRLTNEDWKGTEFERSAQTTAKKPVRKLAFFGDEARECGLLVDHQGILAAARTLLGNKTPKLHQTMMLLKPPKVGREKPWHQDHAYFDMRLADRIVGVWIALDEATIENGCMQFLAGGHTLGPVPHWQRRDWQICDTDVVGKQSVAAPLKPGGLVFFDSLVPHGTPSNKSPFPRRAIQLHFAPEGGIAVSTEQRMALFGSAGKDVSC